MTTAPTPSLRTLAEAAEGNGEHIYTHPRDSNKWRENEAWHRAASPGAVLHLLDRIHDLERKVGRIQGVPLPLIDAINAATGSNDWQGDHSPTELLEPACSAITGLQTEREEEIESANNWRRLALQFDGHRMQALAHLRTLLASPEAHRAVASEFLAAPPLSGAAVLAQRLAELEARKPLPLSYRSGVMTSSIDGGATVSLHFNDMAEAEAWFVAITDQHDAGLVDKTVKLQDRQRFWGFFHSTCIYESDAELISLHATKAGAWRAMHRAQWLAWEEVRTLQMAGRREPGWKAYVHEASHIGLVEVQP